MNLYHSLRGMVDVELTSADIPGSLMAVSGAGISMHSVVFSDDLTATVRIPAQDYSRMTKLCQKRGDKVRICGRKGIYWDIKVLGHRPILVLGLAFLLAMTLYLPTRVLFVRVEGNGFLSDRQILEAADYCGIRFGASRRNLRSEQIKNQLMQQIPTLQWVGVNTKGCVAVISVREKSQPEDRQLSVAFGNVVALRDGVITSCTATRGNLLCSPGQAVTQGQILISGYTDCGLTIQVCRAEGEVYGKTMRHLEAVFPLQWEKKPDVMETKRKISLLIGKKRINLWKDSGIWDTTCGRIYAEKYITLPGGFVFPVGLSVDMYSVGIMTPTIYPKTWAEDQLKGFADAYVKGQTLAGILETKNYRSFVQNGIYRLEGEYVCTEMIGKLQTVKIGESNG